MELLEISGEEYRNLVNNRCSVYSTYEFLELNSYKVDKLKFFLGKNSKNRLAVAFGEKDGV